MRQRALQVLGALSLFVTVAFVTGCGSSTSITGVATGSVTCRTLTGLADFSPPLTLSGTAPETLTITVNARGCSTSDSNVTHVVGATGTITNSTGTSGCTSLLNSKAFEVLVHWRPKTIRPSEMRFFGYTPSTGGTGSGLDFPGSNGKATVTGSFAGSDHGATSKATAVISQGEVQLLAACQNPAGISALAITSGRFTLG